MVSKIAIQIIFIKFTKNKKYWQNFEFIVILQNNKNGL